MVFDNVLSMVSPPKNIKRTWFVDWFYGSALKGYWDQNDITGVGTFAMADGIDEGFSISTTATNGNASSIVAANTERKFDPVGSVHIAIIRRVSANGGYIQGLGNRADGDIGNTPDESIRLDNLSTATFIRLATINGVSSTSVNTSIPIDTVFHRSRLELTPTTATAIVDGILEGTITTTLPLSSSKLYTGFRSISLGAFVSESRIRYTEVFNT
jgi:hypothetical protein